MDKATAKNVQTALADAARTVAANNGLEPAKISASYDSGIGTMRVVLTFRSVGPDAQRAACAAMAEDLMLTKNPYGEQVTMNRTKYTVVGYEPNRSRFPVRAQRVSDGKVFLLPTDALKAFGGLAADFDGVLNRAALAKQPNDS